MSEPILWHIRVSHYSEKVRWALDHKGVDHQRRTPLPGFHMAEALALTRGRSYTLPILELDGDRIGDSTAIIAALERRDPEPPLYPPRAEDRRRALELEHWFDEQLGPYMRRLAFHELRRDRELFAGLSREEAPAPLKRFPRLLGAYGRAFTAVRYGAASDRQAVDARQKILAALDRLEAELSSDGYLVGGRFTVADLTAAALFYPLVQPPEGPRRLPLPAAFADFRETVADRRGFRWVQEMFARHRRPGADRAAA